MITETFGVMRKTLPWQKETQQTEKDQNQRCHQQYGTAPATPATLNIDLSRHFPLTLHILGRKPPAAMRTEPRIRR
jgi:hypothetical protein